MSDFYIQNLEISNLMNSGDLRVITDNELK